MNIKGLKIHIVGICGMGMSALAELSHCLGALVQGSDTTKSSSGIISHLLGIGINVNLEQNARNITSDISLVVASSAIRADNPELLRAQELCIPVMHRIEFLSDILSDHASIGVSGTHGKTTTTSLLGFCMDKACLDPLIISGGIMKEYGSTLRYGRMENTVIEADESDKSFVKLQRYSTNIVTNIEPEHLENYASFDEMKSLFTHFLNMSEKYAIACINDPVLREILPNVNANVLTYGIGSTAFANAGNIRIDGKKTIFDLFIDGAKWADISLGLMGIHNVQNAMAVICALHANGIDENSIREGLESFPGVHRRLTVCGKANGITFIDDYAHHPTEIRAVLRVLREANPDKKIIAVLQPHRYSRLSMHMDDFADSIKDADHTIVMPVYSAGEDPVSGASEAVLYNNMRAKGYSAAVSNGCVNEICDMIRSYSTGEGTVICLGAGDITELAYALPGKI